MFHCSVQLQFGYWTDGWCCWTCCYLRSIDSLLLLLRFVFIAETERGPTHTHTNTLTFEYEITDVTLVMYCVYKTCLSILIIVLHKIRGTQFTQGVVHLWLT